MGRDTTSGGIIIKAPVSGAFREILTPEALSLIGTLAREFDGRRISLLERRKKVQADIDSGKFPDFLEETREIREATDGTWVAHPGLVEVTKAEFDRLMPGPNQLGKLREDVRVTAKDLLELPGGTITEAGLRTNISVAIQYMAAWLSGTGSVPINHLMEDAATAEISRTQIWHWVHHPRGVLDDGRKVTIELFRSIEKEELQKIKNAVGAKQFENGNYEKAAGLLSEIITAGELQEFLTLKAYEYLD